MAFSIFIAYNNLLNLGIKTYKWYSLFVVSLIPVFYLSYLTNMQESLVFALIGSLWGIFMALDERCFKIEFRFVLSSHCGGKLSISGYPYGVLK